MFHYSKLHRSADTRGNLRGIPFGVSRETEPTFERLSGCQGR